MVGLAAPPPKDQLEDPKESLLELLAAPQHENYARGLRTLAKHVETLNGDTGKSSDAADAVNQLLAQHPDAQPVFQALDAARDPQGHLQPLFATTLAGLIAAAKPLGHAGRGIAIARTAVQDHGRDITRALASGKPYLATAFLQLVTAAVRASPAVAQDVCLRLDWSTKGLDALARGRSTGPTERASVRSRWLELLVAMAQHGSTAVRKHLLVTPVLLPASFRGLAGDAAPEQLALLAALLDYIVADAGLAKNDFLRAFQVPALQAVAALLDRPTVPATVQDAAAVLLVRLCGSAGAPLIYADRGLYTAVPVAGQRRRLANPILDEFVFRELLRAGAGPRHVALAAAVLEHCPELRLTVWRCPALSLAGTDAERIVAALELWARIVQLPLGNLSVELPPPPAANALAALLLPAATRLAVNRGLQNASELVAWAWLHAVRRVCESFVNLMQSVDGDFAQNVQPWHNFAENVRIGLTRVLPTQQTLLALATRFAGVAAEQPGPMLDSGVDPGLLIVQSLAVLQLLEAHFPEARSGDANRVDWAALRAWPCWASLGSDVAAAGLALIDDLAAAAAPVRPARSRLEAIFTALKESGRPRGFLEVEEAADAAVEPALAVFAKDWPQAVSQLRATLKRGSRQTLKADRAGEKEVIECVEAVRNARETRPETGAAPALAAAGLKYGFESVPVLHLLRDELPGLILGVQEARDVLAMVQNHSRFPEYFAEPGATDDRPRFLVANVATVQTAIADLVVALVSTHPAELATPALVSAVFGEYNGSRGALRQLLELAETHAGWSTLALVRSQCERLARWAPSSVAIPAMAATAGNRPCILERLGWLDPVKCWATVQTPAEGYDLEMVIRLYADACVATSESLEWNTLATWLLETHIPALLIRGLSLDSPGIRTLATAGFRWTIERLERAHRVAGEHAQSLRMLCQFYFALEPNARVSGAWTLFAAEALAVAQQPGHWLYGKLLRLLERRACLLLDGPPPFVTQLFFSAEGAAAGDADERRPLHQREQLLAMRVLCHGAAAAGDLAYYERHALVPVLCSAVESRVFGADLPAAARLLADLFATLQQLQADNSEAPRPLPPHAHAAWLAVARASLPPAVAAVFSS